MNPKQKIGFILSWILLAIALILFFTRCSPVQRLERMQKRHPYLFNKTNDTIIYNDTVRITIPGTKIDTVLHERTLTDTVTLTRDNMTIKLWKVHDSIYVAGKTDTIYKQITRDIKVPYTKYVADVPKKSFLGKIGDLFLYTFILFVIACGIYLLWKLYLWFESK